MTYFVRHTLHGHIPDELLKNLWRDYRRRLLLGITEDPKLFCECGKELIGFKRQKKDVCEFCEMVEEACEKFSKAPTEWSQKTSGYTKVRTL